MLPIVAVALVAPLIVANLLIFYFAPQKRPRLRIATCVAVAGLFTGTLLYNLLLRGPDNSYSGLTENWNFSSFALPWLIIFVCLVGIIRQRTTRFSLAICAVLASLTIWLGYILVVSHTCTYTDFSLVGYLNCPAPEIELRGFPVPFSFDGQLHLVALVADFVVLLFCALGITALLPALRSRSPSK